MRKGYFETMRGQPYRIRLYIETYLAKELEDSKTDDNTTALRKFELLLQVILKYAVDTVFPQNSPYEVM